MTPLTLLVLAGLAVLLAFLVRRRGREATARPPVASHPSGDGRPRGVDENVQFTVYRPRRIPPETWCPVLAFAHLAERRADAPPGDPDPVEEMQRQAQQVLGDQAAAYAGTTQDSTQAIPHEGEITFVLDLPGVQVNPPQRSFRWLEDVHREEFRVNAPAALDGHTVRGALHVHLGALLVADVALAVRIDGGAARSAVADTEADQARPYRRIFPSYSHRDEAIVRQVEAYARTMGDEYLRDVTHLRSGEVWDDRLRDFIRTADVFQLFWSRNSMASPWVRQEWEYALSLGRPHFVRPTYWEMPMPEAPERDLPPATLRALHFQRLPVRVDLPAPPTPARTPLEEVPEPRVDVDDDRTVGAPRAPTPSGGAPPPSTSAPPRARRRRIPAALAALLLVGFLGSTLVWRSGQIGGPSTAPPESPSLRAVSPDGMRLASVDAEGRIRIASRDDPASAPLVIATRLRPSEIVDLRFSPDGHRLVCELRDGTTVEWDARTGTRVARTAPVQTGRVSSRRRAAQRSHCVTPPRVPC
jgi:hypothetical protein